MQHDYTVIVKVFGSVPIALVQMRQTNGMECGRLQSQACSLFFLMQQIVSLPYFSGLLRDIESMSVYF